MLIKLTLLVNFLGYPSLIIMLCKTEVFRERDVECRKKKKVNERVG